MIIWGEELIAKFLHHAETADTIDIVGAKFVVKSIEIMPPEVYGGRYADVELIHVQLRDDKVIEAVIK